MHVLALNMFSPLNRTMISVISGINNVCCIMAIRYIDCRRKSLKIPKGQSESENRQHNGQKKKYKTWKNRRISDSHYQTESFNRVHLFMSDRGGVRWLFCTIPQSSYANYVMSYHGWLEIRILCPSGATCPSADCCFSELVL
jgi:hypothetical protein